MLQWGSVVVGPVPVESTGCCHSEQEPATHDFKGPEMEKKTWALNQPYTECLCCINLGLSFKINVQTTHAESSMLSTLNSLDMKTFEEVKDTINNMVFSHNY